MRSIPSFRYRFLAWMISSLLYRLEVRGEDNLPQRGAALLVCNHVTYLDWLIVGGASGRPLRFVMDAAFVRIPVARTLMRHARIIPIAPRKRDPEVLDRAMETIAAELSAGAMVCIFPEGRLTEDGRMLDFKPGVERILSRNPVPVIPMALNGLWGSSFSRIDGRPKLFRRSFSRVSLTIDPPISPEGVTAETLRDRVEAIWSRRPELP